ncbi:PAS domain-containing sensor histidine kinase [Neolewinella lacunae]|uniref:histidine kinase n=1 Tax=Neolewinella lacunae TaxID=1517758 RepID=A0A923PR09_9BACT|nr:PAS domain-containing sensor histidine kinase [Neolewinella lacunae]MBC6995899.1 PAS domain-containing sensor histidine kinase [Neolewinella lacunae]MDN3636409.1 PAS domain-containing sensor histidine kinase [Neolewinella lacunae]
MLQRRLLPTIVLFVLIGILLVLVYLIYSSSGKELANLQSVALEPEELASQRTKDSLERYLHITDLAVLQPYAENLDKAHRFFVDSLSGEIIVHPDPEKLGQTNLAALGTKGDTAFLSIKEEVLKRPNQFVKVAYKLDSLDGGARLGTVYYDTTKAWIYGYVINRDVAIRDLKEIAKNYESQIRTKLTAIIFILIVGIIAFPISYFIFLKKLEDRKRQIQKGKELTSNLQNEISELELAIDETTTGMAVLDTNAIISWANKQFKSYFMGEVEGKNFLDVSYYPEAAAKIEECLERGESTYQNTGRASGKTRVSSVKLNKFLVNDEHKILVLVTDITEIATIFDYVAHDMKYPLNTARMAVETLQYKLHDGDSKDSILNSANIIHAGIVSYESFVLSMNVYAKYRSPFVEKECKVNVDLNQLIEDVARVYRLSAEVYEVEVEYNVTEPIVIHTDQRILEAVLRNILSNSFKAVADQPVKKVSLTATVNEDGDLMISVVDTGEGMTPEQAVKLFNPLSDNSGMGSFIAASFVKEAGGTIYVARTGPLDGTEIKIILPLFN